MCALLAGRSAGTVCTAVTFDLMPPRVVDVAAGAVMWEARWVYLVYRRALLQDGKQQAVAARGICPKSVYQPLQRQQNLQGQEQMQHT